MKKDTFEFKSIHLSTGQIIFLGLLFAAITAVAINFAEVEDLLSLVIGGIAGTILFIAILQKPELGGYILIFSVFTNLWDLFTEKGLPSINKPLVVIMLLSIFVNHLFRTGKLTPVPRISKIELALFAYCVVVILSSRVAINQSSSTAYIIDLMKDIAVGICVYISLNSKEKWKTGARVLIGALTFVSILGVLHTLAGSDQTFWGFAQQSAFGQTTDSGELRFGGPIAESNVWGQVLVSIIPFAIYRLVAESKQTVKFAYLSSLFFILMCVLFTQSRGAFVALAITAALMVFDMKIKGSTLAIAGAVVVVFLFIIPSKYTERIRTLDVLFKPDQEYGLSQDQSVEGRRNKMLTGLAMYKANPILGVGFANYTDNYYAYVEDLGVDSAAKDLATRREPHSLYIEIMAETGTLGIITFMAYLGFLFLDLNDVRKRYLHSKSVADNDWAKWVSSTIMSMLTFLIAGFFLHGINFRYIWILSGMSLAIIHIARIDPPLQIPERGQHKSK